MKTALTKLDWQPASDELRSLYAVSEATPSLCGGDGEPGAVQRGKLEVTSAFFLASVTLRAATAELVPTMTLVSTLDNLLLWNLVFHVFAIFICVFDVRAAASVELAVGDLRVWVAVYEAMHGVGWLLVDPDKGDWEWAAGYEIPDDAVRLDRPRTVRT